MLKRRKTKDKNITYLWHRCFGHIWKKNMKKLHVDGILELFDFESNWRLWDLSKYDLNPVHRPILNGRLTWIPYMLMYIAHYV